MAKTREQYNRVRKAVPPDIVQERIARLLAEGKISQEEAQKRLDGYLSYLGWAHEDFSVGVRFSSTDFLAGSFLPIVRGKIPRAPGSK